MLLCNILSKFKDIFLILVEPKNLSIFDYTKQLIKNEYCIIKSIHFPDESFFFILELNFFYGKKLSYKIFGIFS